MICKFCNKEIVDDAAFCSYCGCAIEHEASVEQAPIAVPTPPQKRHVLVKGLVAAAVAVVAVTALLLNMETLTGTVMKTFFSSTEYYKYVELKTSKSDTDMLSGYYALFKDTLIDPSKRVEGELHVTWGEEVAGMPADLAWLNDRDVAYTGNYQDGRLSLELVMPNEEKPFTWLALWDVAENRAFLGLPGEEETYLALDVPQASLPNALPAEVETLLLDPTLIEELKAAMPSERELDNLLERYLAIALDMVEVTSSESVDLTVDGVTQKCTKMELAISQKQAIDILTAILTEARDDGDVREVLERTQALLAEQGQTDGDLYANYRTAVTNALNKLSAARKTAGDEIAVTVTAYIDNRHTVIGRRMVVGANEVFYYATVEADGTCASELRITNKVELRGRGQTKGNSLSGEYELLLHGATPLRVTVTDFDLSKVKDGYVNGTFAIRPQAAQWNGIDDPMVVLALETSRTKYDMTAQVYTGDTLLFAVETANKIGRGEEVTLPEEPTQLSDWLETAEGDTVAEKLENAGFPAQTAANLAAVLATVNTR